MIDIAEAVGRALRPPPRITVAEWADEHRVLPSTTAEPGRWRTDRTPYMREMMEVLSPGSPIRELALMKSAQVGGTELLLNMIGHAMMVDSAPMLVVQPTEDTARSWSKKRLDPMLTSTPGLSALFGPSKRNPKNKTTYKEWAGGFCRIAWSRSAPQLRSDPIRDVLLDEVDGYPDDLDGEGDPVQLAIARTRTFSDRRRVVGVSTPTIKDHSRIERWFHEGDQRYYHVPCPCCGYKFALELSMLRRTADGVCVVCPECQEEIDESHKSQMLQNGEWIPTAESRSDDFRSYHISALYAPAGWYTWVDVLDEYDAAQTSDEPNAMRVFFNTVLGLPYESRELEQTEWKPLFLRRGNHERGWVPGGAGILTAGADVQGDRIEVEVLGWGRGLCSWSIDYLKIYGDPTQPAIWEELTEALNQSWPGEKGALFQISRLAIDSGFCTQEVYQWAATVGMRRAMPVKGASHSLPTLVASPQPVELDLAGRKRKSGVHIRRVNTERLKDYVKRSIELTRLPDEDPPNRWCEWPAYPREYFEQLCSERRVQRGARWKWEKPSKHTRNEALDVRVYNLAAMLSLGVDRWTDDKWDSVLAEVAQSATQGVEAPQVIRQRKGRRYVDSSYLHR